MSEKKRIGLLGGAFNPIHYAHLRIAEEAREACGLDRVMFIPTGDPPHKTLAGDVSFDKRCRMVMEAIMDNPCFELSEVEGNRPGKSYSIDTIEYYRGSVLRDELFFIIGGDSFKEIGSWYRYQDIFRQCNLVVVGRPGFSLETPLELLPVAIRHEFRYTAATHRLEHEAGTQVHLLSGCPMDISSSAVRLRAAAGRSLRYLVPPGVEEYIQRQGTYN